MASSESTTTRPQRFAHSYAGIAEEAAKAIGCDGEYADGTCFENVPEPTDYNLCNRCHLVWRLQGFEEEATDWWNELDNEPLPTVTDRPCKSCGFVLRFAPLGTGVVQDTSMRGVPGGPYPEFVPGDRTTCLRCIVGVEAPGAP